MSTPKKNKKIVFDDTDIRHAQLKIRLQHDNLTQSEFFRAMITGYLEKNATLLEYIQHYKEANQKQSKRSIKRVSKDTQKGKSKMEQFGLIEGELENIFDLIASEHPDL